MRVRDGGDCFVDVIEDYHAIVEREAQIGQLAIIVRRTFETFDITHRVVPRVADGAPAEARQPGDDGRAILLEGFLEQLERIEMRDLARLAFCGWQGNAHLAVP